MIACNENEQGQINKCYGPLVTSTTTPITTQTITSTTAAPITQTITESTTTTSATTTTSKSTTRTTTTTTPTVSSTTTTTATTTIATNNPITATANPTLNSICISQFGSCSTYYTSDCVCVGRTISVPYFSLSWAVIFLNTYEPYN
jgi:hypothetical protein